MNARLKTAVYLSALVLLVTVGGFLLPKHGQSAPPPITSYTLGPFDAVGVDLNPSVARTAAMADMWDQIFGVGGIASQLPAGELVVAIDVVSEEFVSPGYTITFTVTVDEDASGLPGGPPLG